MFTPTLIFIIQEVFWTLDKNVQNQKQSKTFKQLGSMGNTAQ